MSVLVLFSGGLDSTLCLVNALRSYESVYTLGFDYGQSNKLELMFRRKLLSKLKRKNLKQDFLIKCEIGDSHNRNAVFLALSHTIARRVNTNTIVLGVCSDDTHQDCDVDKLIKLNETLNLFNDSSVNLSTPLSKLNKSGVWLDVQSLPDIVRDTVIENTYTCYENSLKRNAWGYGCGECSACELRSVSYNL